MVAMDGKKIAVVCAVAVVAVIAGAYLIDGYCPVDDVRTEPQDGDMITYAYTEHSGELSETWEHTMEVLNYNKDGTLAIADHVKDMINLTSMTVEAYVGKVVIDIPEGEAEIVGEEKIDTPFGQRDCDVYVHDGSGFTLKLWIGKGSGVLYHTVETADNMPADMYMECWLTECSLFS